jgi:hypothetical protein
VQIMHTGYTRLIGLLAFVLLAPGVRDAGAQATPPAFQLETAKARYLVGEPVVVTVTQRGPASMYDEGWAELGDQQSHLRVLIDRGAGFTRFQRRVLRSPGERLLVRTLVPDQRRQEFVLSLDDAIGDVVFPTPGIARIVIEYQDGVLGVVRSNAAIVEIAAPRGAELTAYERIRALPDRGQQFYLELTAEDDAPDLSDAGSQSVLAAFPRSAYVQGARVRSLAYRVSHPSDRLEAGDLSSPAPTDREERRRLARQRRAALVQDAEALATDLAGSQFEPDALVVLAATYAANNQDDLARHTWQRIVDRFPTRAAADSAREALEPDDPANQRADRRSADRETLRRNR